VSSVAPWGFGRGRRDRERREGVRHRRITLAGGELTASSTLLADARDGATERMEADALEM